MVRKLSDVKVYIAGPYTNGDKEENTLEAIKWGNTLFNNGFVPFIPHLTHFWDVQHPHEYTDWLAYDLKWLRECQCVFRIPGESPGADLEECAALMLNIPIFYDIAELLSYYSLNIGLDNPVEVYPV